MKRILFGTFAVALLLASCAQDELVPAANGDEANVTVNINLPKNITSRAYSDGFTATHLQYALYDVTYGTPTKLDKYTVTDAEINISEQINFTLVNGHTYRFVFWASAPNADGPYTVDFGDNDATFTVDYANQADFFKANLEDLDAFYVCEDVAVKGDVQKTFELRRPFAQLNIGTSDYDDAAAVGYKPDFSYVQVNQAYTTLDLMTGKVEDPVTMTYNWNIVDKTQDFPVDGHEYMAMAYVLTGADEASLTNVVFSYRQEGVDAPEGNTRTFGSVPLQRNYRTNIYGSILTSDVDVNIVIEPDYYDPDFSVTGKEVTTEQAASDLASEGEDVRFGSDIKCGVLTQNVYGQNWAAIIQNGGTIDGAGHTLNVGAYTNTTNNKENYGIWTSGGTIKNLTIVNAFRGIYAAEKMQEDLYIDNCVLKSAYTINTAGSTYDYAMHVTNTELYGWTTWAAFTEATFTDCKFLPSIAWPDTKAYWLCRAYVPTTFTNCDFDKDYTISLCPSNSEVVANFVNCTVAGEPLTRENIKLELMFYKTATDKGQQVIVHYNPEHKIKFVIDGQEYEVTCPDDPHEGQTVEK